MIEICTREDGQGAEIDLCERCGGVFFDFFDGEPGNLSRSLVDLQQTPVIRATADQPARCPDCDRPMTLTRYMERGPVLRRCDSCVGVFVNHDQIEAMASFVAEERPEDDGDRRGLFRRICGLFTSD